LVEYLLLAYHRPGSSRVERRVSGTGATTFAETVPAMHTVQLLRPYQTVVRDSETGAGYARVELVSGRWASAYASVVDNLGSDPTTIPMVF